MDPLHGENRGKRRDLFYFVRSTLCVAVMYPFWYYNQKIPTYSTVIMNVIYEFFCYFVCVHIAALYICTIVINFGSGDLQLIVNCLIQTIIYIWVMIMKIYFRRNRPEMLNDIMNLFNQKYYQRSELGFTYVSMDDAINIAIRWSKVYIYSCYIGTLFWIVLPIVYRDRSLPLACWYPFDYTQPLVYEVVFFLQAAGQVQVAAAFGSSSALYLALGVLISGQYDILCCSLKNILATTYIKMGATSESLRMLEIEQSVSDAEINQYAFSEEHKVPIKQLVWNSSHNNNNVDDDDDDDYEFTTNFRICLNRCVDHHHYIESVALLLCLVAFMFVKSSSANSLMRFMSLGQYLLLVLYELFIICYGAELVNQNSLRTGEALWRSPWHLHLVEIRNEYLFFFLNSKRNFQLTAGKMIYLNIERFRSTITTAFSFLTLLQKLDARN